MALALGFISAHAIAVTDAVVAASETTAAKKFLEEFYNAASIAKACKYREDAIYLYYSTEYARLIRHEAIVPTLDPEVNVEVGIAMATAKTYATQRTEGRKFTAEQCGNVRKAIDERVPRGYDRP
jgi:hypothetical protein